jgi:feruloyl esterase
MMTSLAFVLFATFAQQQSACEGLKTLTLQHTTITAAELRPAGAAQPGRGRGAGTQLPAHCRVAAVLAPSSDSHIEMELWMPAENWNGKFMAVGNGGWAGNIETGAVGAALARGYAAASNDTGHNRNDGTDGAFALGHPEKVIDFGYRAMHEMAVQSKAIIQAFYKQGPRLSYYQGCSTGGRQGLSEAQRYPEDFDAIIAGAPVYNQTRLHASQMSLFVDMLRRPDSILSNPKKTMVANAVLGACDEQDGVKDSLITNPQKCKFDPAVLLCKAGDADTCLSAAQVETAKKTYAPVTLKTSELVYPPHSFGFETGWRMATAGGTPPNLPGDSFRILGHQNTSWNLNSFDLDSDLALALKNGGNNIDAINPDLSKFKARGGKLILWHGWADPGPAPENTINYLNAVKKQLGGETNDWMRLFLLPGVAHCGGGNGPDQADYLTPMENWREKGIAPDQIVASRNRGGQVDMTRPLCAYPQVAKYSGSGDTNDAKNFKCAAP